MEVLIGLIGQVSQQKYTGLQYCAGLEGAGGPSLWVGGIGQGPSEKEAAGKIKGDFLEEVVYEPGLEGWTLTSPLAYWLSEFCAC